MLLPLVIVVSWLAHLVACFYFIRFIPNTMTRSILTFVPCVVLTYIISRDLPALHMPSMLLVSFCWLVSIRFIHLAVLSPNQSLTFRSFVLKVLWIFFPIVPCASAWQKQWPILFDFLFAGVKLITQNWMHRWLLTCESSDSYARMVMYYIYIVSYSWLADVQIALIRIVTRDKYTLQSLTNFPILSQSVREFWGRRYNQHVGTILRESIFQPVLFHLSSPVVASLITFLISGLLHVHLALVTFKDSRATVPTMIFFLLHGIACCVEAHMGFRLPKPLGWLLTHAFLLATAPLFIGPFTRSGPEIFAVNPPPLFENKWVPQLPVPIFCPK